MRAGAPRSWGFATPSCMTRARRSASTSAPSLLATGETWATRRPAPGAPRRRSGCWPAAPSHQPPGRCSLKPRPRGSLAGGCPMKRGSMRPSATRPRTGGCCWARPMPAGPTLRRHGSRSSCRSYGVSATGACRPDGEDRRPERPAPSRMGRSWPSGAASDCFGPGMSGRASVTSIRFTRGEMPLYVPLCRAGRSGQESRIQ